MTHAIDAKGTTATHARSRYASRVPTMVAHAMSVTPTCAALTTAVTTLVPIAPASCCRVLITALPSALIAAGKNERDSVMVLPTMRLWPKAKHT